MRGCSRSRRVTAAPPGRPRLDRSPRPAALGQWRLGVGDRDPPDPVLSERQGEPGKLPARPGAPSRLWHEQRELLTGRRSRAIQLQGKAGDRGRWRSPFQVRKQQALDRLGVRGRLREALLDLDPRRRPGRGERQVQLQTSWARSAAPAPRRSVARRARPTSRWRTKRSGSSSSTGGSIGSPRASRSGASAAGTDRSLRPGHGHGVERPLHRTGRPTRTGRAPPPPRSGAGRSG